MKKNNIIIFLAVILIIFAILYFAIWDAKHELSKLGENSDNVYNEISKNETTKNETQTNVSMNESTTNITNVQDGNTDYKGTWYINQEAYLHSERIDDIMERREENIISEEDFQKEIESESNKSIVKLDVEEYFQNQIKFDFENTSPAPNQREGKLDDIVVELDNGVGTFTYTDNWGTSGNGTITLSKDKIELKLETIKAGQGVQWGVEGIYTFMYKLPN